MILCVLRFRDASMESAFAVTQLRAIGEWDRWVCKFSLSLVSGMIGGDSSGGTGGT